MDSASDSGSEGWGFESLRACQTGQMVFLPYVLFCFYSMLFRQSDFAFARLLGKGLERAKHAPGIFCSPFDFGRAKSQFPAFAGNWLFVCPRRETCEIREPPRTRASATGDWLRRAMQVRLRTAVPSGFLHCVQQKQRKQSKAASGDKRTVPCVPPCVCAHLIPFYNNKFCRIVVQRIILIKMNVLKLWYIFLR